MEIGSLEAGLARAIARQVIDEIRQRQSRVAATYRLQLNRDFTFWDAIEILPYLKGLGVSHVYCSPYLRARRGSTHGYDICDHSEFNPELGGETGFREFVAALRSHGMGHILDLVPNHMAASLENPWWVDVLENGPISPYSSYFDIDWKPVKQELADKVLLPVLGQQYGEALEEGRLTLTYRAGAFFVRYYDHEFPLGPKTAIPLLSDRLNDLRATLGADNPHMTELESIITALEHLPPQSARDPSKVRERHREKEVIKRRLRELTTASETIRGHILQNVLEYTPDSARPESINRLDHLLDAQAYRLCHWRSAADEINYRRFFDVNDLAAICMELPDVFYNAHALLRPYLADGTIAGLRIDHVDGLYDPEQYLWRLQWAYLADVGERFFRERPSGTPAADGSEAPASPAADSLPLTWEQLAPAILSFCAQELGMRQPLEEDLRAVLSPSVAWQLSPSERDRETRRQSTNAPTALYVLVEKILGPDEPLPEKWPVAGTSGYDFLNSLSGLFLQPEGYAEIVQNYGKFIDQHRSLKDVEHDSKRLILRVSMSSELQMLAHRLNHISEQHRRSRDFTLNMLRLAIREVLVCFSAYRAYPGRDGISDRDRMIVNQAVIRARRRNPAFDPAVFEFLRSVLLLNHPPGLSPAQITDREIFTGKFQQVTSPVMAKGVEDTAFYVHVPLLAVNEVGNEPARAVTTIPEFHAANRHRQHRWPNALLATSTHDTKRSEDVRARLLVLTEVPDLWRKAAYRFTRANKRFLREVDGEPAPSRNDEYLFYQTVLAIWPLQNPDAQTRQVLIERLTQYMEKATHEAKLRTSWNNPHPEYDEAVRDFVAQTLRESPKNKFLKELHTLHAKIAAAGQYNALSQVVLKLLSPGVPDLYQGQELWDDSLVDPDNRRPVDFGLRRKLLAEIRAWEGIDENDRRSRVIALGRSWSDPRLKLLVTSRLLILRRMSAELFSRGEYVSLETTGKSADHVVALGWRPYEDQPLELIAVVPRQMRGLLNESAAIASGPLWTESAWTDATLKLPEGNTHDYRSLFTERTHVPENDSLPVSQLLSEFPIGVLRRV